MRMPLVMWLLLVAGLSAGGSGVLAQTQDQDDELSALRRAAAGEAARQQMTTTEESGEGTVFESGSLGLQKLNPEISVTGDMLGIYQSGDDGRPAYDTMFRSLGLHMEAYLDPYSHFKAAVPFSTEGAELGEVYFTRYGFLGGVNLTLGKFRQQFGVVNRWHKHALDTFDFPLALRSIFGPGGLNQMGLSLDGSTATGSLVHSLTVQATDGDNPFLFGGNFDNRPSILGHYKLYRDLSASTYLQLGGTGLVGWNDTWTVEAVPTPVTREERLTTAVYGVDLSLFWEPTGNMRYRNFQWRSEAYFLDQEILAPDGSGRDSLKPWGMYSLVQAKVSRTVEIGARFDYFAPETRSYAGLGVGPDLGPKVVSAEDAHRQGTSAWLTWWQSPFVKFRAGYSYETGSGTGPDVHSVALQMVFAAGPHKHDRY